jgi:hypothetical protein
MAPDCSSFSFPNSFRCKRKFTNSFKGDENYPPVQSGNIMAEVACFFFALAMQRGLYVGLENSAGSTIFSYLGPWLQQLPKRKVYIIHRCSYDTSAVEGTRMKKGYKFLVSGPDCGVWFAPAAQRCRCSPNTHTPLMETRGNQVSGTPNLRASQAYPAAMGIAIVQAWLKEARPWRSSPAVQPQDMPFNDYSSSEDEDSESFAAEANPWQHLDEGSS